MSIKTSFANLCAVLKEMLGNKVDKVSGKGLSTNDYTTAEKTKLAGIATGANKTTVDSGLDKASTNPVQNKAVYAKFQGVDSEISGINSSLDAKTDEIATIVNKYGSKNLVDYSLIPNLVASGITRKNNNDGSIAYSGTSTLTTATYLPLMASQSLDAGTYIFTPNPTTTASYTYQIYKNGSYWKGITANQAIEITEAGDYSIGIALDSKAAINNTFKPMLRYSTIKDNTFVPYAMTNRELTEKIDDKVDKVDGKGLSTNDFTAAYKTKLDGITAGANKTTVDGALSTTSTNPVQNKVLATKISTIETNVSAAATTAGNAAASAAAVKNDLANYYKKTETYSQTEINNKISAIPKFGITVCEALPDSNISKTTVYLLKSSKEETDNLYDEYIYVNSKWEKLGTQTVGDIAGLTTRMTAAEANINQHTSSISTINTNLTKKQDKLTAGTNITISGTTISAKDTTYSAATTSAAGLMSAADKTKLNGIATGANKTVVDDSLSSTSKNPVQNMVITGQISTLAADLTDLKTWKTNISKTVSDIQTDTATITKDEFTTMLS